MDWLRVTGINVFFYSWSTLSVISFSIVSRVVVNNILYKALLSEARVQYFVTWLCFPWSQPFFI